MRRHFAILAMILSGALLAPAGARAQIRFAQQDPFGDMRGNFSAEEARDARQTGQVNIDSRQARAIALAQFPGAEYLDMEIGRGPRGPEYHVFLKTGDGRRVEVVLDAQTGQVLRSD